MKKVLLISPDSINKKMAGPAIRYYNFAKELSNKLEVTLFIPNKASDVDFSDDKFQVIYGDSSKLKKISNYVDSVVVQGIAFRLYPFLRSINKPIVVDIYDPITLENLELRKFLPMKERLDYHEGDLDLILEQLSKGDYFICASEKQKDYWMGMLAAINRVNPMTYNDDIKMEKLIGVVPFGLDNSKPEKTKSVLKGVWPGIEKDDKVIIWGGGIWNWFDPLTLIEAMNIICKKQKNIKLFFMGIGHPHMANDRTVADECIELSKKYGIYNTNVFFNEWVEYSERQNYLMESDLGISTYFNNLETMYSFRTRILDYIWCKLPMILTNGDYMANLVQTQELGLCHNERDYNELAEKIIKILEDEELLELYKKNLEEISDQFKWENVTKPLLEFCSDPYISSDKKAKIKIFYNDKFMNPKTKFKYYYLRIKSRIRRLLKRLYNFMRRG